MDDFAEVLSSVRSRTYPYKARPKQKRNWSLYDEAQEHEYPEVFWLIRNVVGEAANSYRLLRKIGRYNSINFGANKLF